MEISNLLVPLDGSELAEKALLHAISLAQRYNSTLILVRVVALVPYMMMPDPSIDSMGYDATAYDYEMSRQLMEISHKETDAYLQAKQQELTDQGITCRTRHLEGDEAGGVVDTAVAENVDAIIMTSHGRSGFSRWMMGSVTERVLREAPCPVFVIRQPKLADSLLIALDGSPMSELALDMGLAVAASRKATTHLVRVLEKVSNRLTSVALDLAVGHKLKKDQLVDARTYLDKIVADRLTDEFRMVTAVVSEGSPAESILEYAETHHIDIIIMATHGRTGLKRWVYGSVTEKIVRGAKCNLLIVRPQDDQFVE